MKSVCWRYWYLTVVAVLIFASASFGQQVTMQLTGVNGGSAGGVYTDPYYGTVNGVAATLICDDYADHSWVGPPTWQATVTNVASITSTTSTLKWIGNGMSTQTLYNTIAYLSTRMLQDSNQTDQEAYSFALWELTCTYGSANPSVPGGDCASKTAPFDSIQTTNPTVYNLATGFLQEALSQTFTAGEYANVTVYTPVGAVDPQEFIRVPEASTIAMLGVDLLGVLAMAFFFRRRGLQLAG